MVISILYLCVCFVGTFRTSADCALPYYVVKGAGHYSRCLACSHLVKFLPFPPPVERLLDLFQRPSSFIGCIDAWPAVTKRGLSAVALACEMPV